jgi:hypothetical protein
MWQVDEGISFLTSIQRVPISILDSDTTFHEGDRSFSRCHLLRRYNFDAR